MILKCPKCGKIWNISVKELFYSVMDGHKLYEAWCDCEDLSEATRLQLFKGDLKVKALTKDRAGRSIWSTRVERHQSTMNKLRWFIGLACGHEKWISCRTTPKLGVREKCLLCGVHR